MLSDQCDNLCQLLSTTCHVFRESGNSTFSGQKTSADCFRIRNNLSVNRHLISTNNKMLVDSDCCRIIVIVSWKNLILVDNTLLSQPLCFEQVQQQRSENAGRLLMLSDQCDCHSVSAFFDKTTRQVFRESGNYILSGQKTSADCLRNRNKSFSWSLHFLGKNFREVGVLIKSSPQLKISI